jgi:hypothetical protein
MSGMPGSKFRKQLNQFTRVWKTLTPDENTQPSELYVIMKLMFDNIREKMGKKSTLIKEMNTDDIREKIEEYLPVKEHEKNKYGEVFTPKSLIDEMLDKLPSNVWKNPNLKWLDPANGTGNFPMVVFNRLMKGLREKIPNKTKRRNHIIKNMLYMVELNPKNVAVSRKIFGPKANIHCGSFLEDGWKEEFNVEKFDVIVGNPPYNKEKILGKGQAKGGNDLYPFFIIKSIEFLNEDGLLCFINPPKWRAPNKKGNILQVGSLLKNKQILFLRIIGFKETKEYFNISGRVDYYILQNKENTKSTEIIDELGEKHLLKLNEMPFLPNYAYKDINKILTTEDKGIDVIYSSSIYDTRKLKEHKTSEYKYPVLHSIKQNGEKIIYYTNDNTKGHFGIPKVIIIKGLYPYSYNDYEGNYGMSNYSFGIPILSKREGDLIMKAIDTPIFKKIIASTKWNSGYTEHSMFSYFKPNWYKIILHKTKSSSTSKKTRKSTSPKSAPQKTRKSRKSTTKKTRRRHSR